VVHASETRNATITADDMCVVAVTDRISGCDRVDRGAHCVGDRLQQSGAAGLQQSGAAGVSTCLAGQRR
jgi:hypothetical protein